MPRQPKNKTEQKPVPDNTEKLRSKKREVEKSSVALETLVNSIVFRFAKDLDQYMKKVKESLEGRDNLADFEIEELCIKVPVFMYFAAEGLEILGIEGDTAKIMKMENFNLKFIQEGGTIHDKTHAAENETITEAILEMAYTRAYKQIKLKLDVCNQLCQASRKVLHKRCIDRQIGQLEPSGIRNIRDREED